LKLGGFILMFTRNSRSERVRTNSAKSCGLCGNGEK
jgi:hypothetical protein